MQDRDVTVGGQIILGAHTPLEPGGDPHPNWTEEMAPFVGVQTQVSSLSYVNILTGVGDNHQSVLCARVEVDNGQRYWHVRDAQPPRVVQDIPPPERNPKFQPGDTVCLGKHTAIPDLSNDLQWGRSMDAFVGKNAVVLGVRRAGMVRNPDIDPWVMQVDIDSSAHYWRMRDCTLVKPAQYVTDATGRRFLTARSRDVTNPREIQAGDTVLLRKHVPRDDNHEINPQLPTSSYWNAEMAEYVDKHAKVKQVHPGTDKGRTTVTVDIDSGKHHWRCLDIILTCRYSGAPHFLENDSVAIMDTAFKLPDSTFAGRTTTITQMSQQLEGSIAVLEVDHHNNRWPLNVLVHAVLFKPKVVAPALSWTEHVRGYV